jgi:hypothetical protein
MDDSSTASSSVDIAADIVRLIPPYEHEAFRVLLQVELNGRELPLMKCARLQSARGTNFSNTDCQELSCELLSCHKRRQQRAPSKKSEPQLERGHHMRTIALILALTVSTTAFAQSSISDQQAFALARKRVGEQLKDPMSAQFGPMFRKVTIGKDGKEHHSICGTVNSKNSFGAYTGATAFIYLINENSAMMDEGSFNIATISCRRQK